MTIKKKLFEKTLIRNNFIAFQRHRFDNAIVHYLIVDDESQKFIGHKTTLFQRAFIMKKV